MEIDLQPFCGTDENRPHLHKPFSRGDYTYATCGIVVVRVPRRSGFEELEDSGLALRIDALLEGLNIVLSFGTLPYRNLPPLPEPIEQDCADCNGRGTEHDCPDCACTCETCNGTGMVTVVTDVSTTIYGGIFNFRYLAKVLTLPGVEFATVRIHESPLLFRFDGGVGAVMPRVTKCDQHVEIELSPDEALARD